MKKNKELILHTFIGLFIGYFIIHPISMVIYWFQLNTNEFSLTDLFNVFFENVKHSFSLHMMPMSVAFSVLGALIGLGSGLYYKTIKKKGIFTIWKKAVVKAKYPKFNCQWRK